MTPNSTTKKNKKMKIKITKQQPSAIQEFFSKPLNFSQRVEKKKLQIAGMICKGMEKLGLNRTKLAKEMGIKPSRVTAMLDGTQNLTIETIMRASEALDLKFECTLVPKTHATHWVSYEKQSQFKEISNVSDSVIHTIASFKLDTSIAKDDYAECG